MAEIIPAILTDSVEELGRDLEELKGRVGRVQIDIVDGMFADNLTVLPLDFGRINWQGLAIDVHLMTEEPIEFLEECSEGPVERVVGQIERMSSQDIFVEQVGKLGMKAGLAVDLYTPIEAIGKEVIRKIDYLLLLAVKAGFSGQKFNQDVLKKIEKLVILRQKKGWQFKIGIDGGINLITGRQCLKAGADELVVTSFLWQSEDIKRRLDELSSLREQYNLGNYTSL